MFSDEDKKKLDIILEALTNKLGEDDVRIFYFVYDKNDNTIMMSGSLCPGCVFMALQDLKSEGELHTHTFDGENSEIIH